MNRKKTLKLIGFIALAALIGLSMAACDNQVNDTGIGNEVNSPRSVAKYEAEPAKNEIKYSYSYKGCYFYYIYLGKLQNIPLFYFTPEYHNGMKSMYKVSSTRTNTTSITETITKSTEAIINVVDTHTTSSATGGKISTEIKADAKLLWGLIKFEGPKAADEYYRNDYIYNSSTTDFQQTTSLVNTVTHGTQITESTSIERAWDCTKDNKTGYYRYTLFSTSDVYLYVIKDSTGNSHCEFREYVIPDNNTYFWGLDYSETSDFIKTDATGFKFDISILKNLPKPEITLPEINLNDYQDSGGTGIGTGSPGSLESL